MTKKEIPAEVAELLDIRPHDGWVGNFTRAQYPAAKYRNGDRIWKAAEDAAGDITPIGTMGTVLGSIGHPTVGAAYFIEWDDKPKHALFVVERKIRAA